MKKEEEDPNKWFHDLVDEGFSQIMQKLFEKGGGAAKSTFWAYMSSVANHIEEENRKKK